jgi:hypothetical protein
MLLFLGAGASKAVGIGDLQDLSEKVNKELSSNGYGHVLTEIIDVLYRANKKRHFFNEGEIDIEVTLSVLNARANHINAMKESGPYSIYLEELGRLASPFDKELPTKEDVSKIKKIVSRIITRSCIQYDATKATKYYEELFNLKNDVTSYRNATQNIKGPAVFDNIVTTNYDLVVDNYYAHIDKDLDRGFDKGDSSDEKMLNLRRIQTQITDDDIQYLQLHGSIDWWLRKRDNKIVKRENPKSLRGEQYPEQIMVYPIYEKHISQDPFFSLYSYFRRLLYSRDIYIVIGYSFRDPSINNAFGDVLRDKTESRMIIVNPNKASIEKCDSI